MKLLIENGFNGVADAVVLLINTVMQIEQSRYLQAEPYEQTEQRQSCCTHGTFFFGSVAKMSIPFVTNVESVTKSTKCTKLRPEAVNEKRSCRPN